MSGHSRSEGEPSAAPRTPTGQREFVVLVSHRRVHLLRVCRLITCDDKSAVEALAEALSTARSLLVGCVAAHRDAEAVLVTAAAGAACAAASRMPCPGTAVGLDEVMAGMPPAVRAAIVLRDVAGLPYDRIADAVAAREGAVRSCVARARRELARASCLLPSQDGASPDRSQGSYGKS